jgi:DNA excision repair protein ERCC-3
LLPACLQVKLVLQQNRFFVESPHPAILRQLLRDSAIADAAVLPDARPGGGGGAGAASGGDGAGAEAGEEGFGGGGGSQFRVGAARRDRAVADLAQIEEIDLAAEEGEEALGHI